MLYLNESGRRIETKNDEVHLRIGFHTFRFTAAQAGDLGTALSEASYDLYPEHERN